MNRNLDLKGDASMSSFSGSGGGGGCSESKIKDRKMTLNFISVTPRQLIEKEGLAQKCVRVNIFAKNQQDLILSLIHI